MMRGLKRTSKNEDVKNKSKKKAEKKDKTRKKDDTPSPGPSEGSKSSSLSRFVFARENLVSGKTDKHLVLEISENTHTDLIDGGQGVPTKKAKDRLLRLLNGDASSDKSGSSTDTEFDPYIVILNDNRNINITNSAVGSGNAVISGSSNSVTTDNHQTTGNQSSTSNTNFTKVDVSTLALGGIGLSVDQAQTNFIYSTLKARWTIVRYIVWKNTETWCRYSFDDTTKEKAEFIKTCLRKLDLDENAVENYLPCLDYLNLIDNTSPTADLDRPCILRDTEAMLKVWQDNQWNERIRSYLQRRLMTYFFCHYLPKENELYQPSYYCIPDEANWRSVVNLDRIDAVFKNVFSEGSKRAPWQCQNFEDTPPAVSEQRGLQSHGSSSMSGSSSSNMVIKSNKRAEAFPEYSFYSSQHKARLHQVAGKKMSLKVARHRVAHTTTGLEAKKMMDLFTSVPGLQKACSFDTIDTHILNCLKLNFKNYFGAGYGKTTDNDNVLSKYVMPNVIEGEMENYESQTTMAMQLDYDDDDDDSYA